MFKSSGTAAARTAARAVAASGKEIIDLTAREIWSDIVPSARWTDILGLMELRQPLLAGVLPGPDQLWSTDQIAVTI
ncbi:hypothetical protein CQ10_41245 [Bradyrhizobium valentinum]|nr:hypothetical protein CQ10_41245 [Bradyrhizobium valentinum]